MRQFFIFLLCALVIGALVLLQSFRALALTGVNPNLALIALLFFLFSRMGKGMFFALLAAFLLFTILLAPFWSLEASALAALMALALFFKRFFTAHPAINYFIFLAVLPAVFYTCLSLIMNVLAHGFAFSLFSLSLPAVLLAETAYDVALGIVVLLLFRGPLSRALRAA